MHPNLIYDNRRGYYNSLHQMIVCYRNLGNYGLADSLISIGLLSTSSNEDFRQEYGYFLKEKGIGEFCKKEYQNSIRTLKRSVESIANVNDFAWASVCYSYIGKSYLELGDNNMAIRYFQKVDSVFQQHGFILPELRSNYEQLLNQYKKQKSTRKELYYTKQLLKADKVISQDFSYLFHKIYKEYDTRTLLEEKVRLEKKSMLSIWVSISLAVFALFLIIFSLFVYRTKRQIHEKYSLLEQKILARNDMVVINNPISIRENNKVDIEKKIVDDLILKLQGFEERMEFTESGITLNKLAAKFDTNQNYLSQVVNDYKGMNFTRYLSELRIAFITDKLYNDKKYLRYKIETLAEECGIASRTNFSNLFQEINGMRPTDFIKKRLADIDDEKSREVGDRF
ncbi:helix-turn-helix domain-containing protein [Chryseobacterium ginsengisoli]